MLSTHTLQINKTYTKNDLYRLFDVPKEKQKGNWNTGYTQYQNDWFIFANVGISGRTGHDYNNYFIGDDLYWFGKTKSTINQPSIQSLLNPPGHIYLFYRQEDKAPFTYAGTVLATDYKDTQPAQITWRILNGADERTEALAEEINERLPHKEGATKTITVNAYERNPQARKDCINHYGCECDVCGFDFEKRYGDIGSGFTHVHHLKQLADIGEEYQVDPINDLRPVCPNCHAMLHKRRPAFSIEELKARLIAES